MRLSRLVLAATVLVAPGLVGCAKEEAKKPLIDIQTPIGDVKIESDEESGRVGVDVQAGGVDVSTDSATGEVNVEVDAADRPAE
ncbi:hypothetical protein MalM25_00180 [Planctomycetes bacterium MalM25]|nr:hypothetical protein MalM25_00180 [Planctomycetes bacterium MalM25]